MGSHYLGIITRETGHASPARFLGWYVIPHFPPTSFHGETGGDMADRTGTWDGGYIRKDARRRTVYVIRQQVNGKRYEVSTRAFSVKAALDPARLRRALAPQRSPAGSLSVSSRLTARSHE